MLLPPYNPALVNKNGLGCSRFARRYSGNRRNLLPDRNGSRASTTSDQTESSGYCFLFLQVLRCFTSLGALPFARIPTVGRRVSPFGHFRVVGYLAPRRNLSQPYHVLHRFLKPRHPPYTLTFLQGTLHTVYTDTLFTYTNVCTPLYNLRCLFALPRICIVDSAFCLPGTKRPIDCPAWAICCLTRQTIPAWIAACLIKHATIQHLAGVDSR